MIMKLLAVKSGKNKNRNFVMKTCMLLFFVLVVMIPLVFTLIYNVNAYKATGDIKELLNICKFSISDTVFFAIALLMYAVLAKWLDVKKYQETWRRHVKHKYELDIEMLKFILKWEKYATSNRRGYFIENIIRSWDKNQDKFQKNMQNEAEMKTLIEKFQSREK